MGAVVNMPIIVRNETKNKELVWRSIKIKKSLEEICHTLEMELMPSEHLKVNKHDRLTVRRKNKLFKSGWSDLITTVLVDQKELSIDNTTHNLKIIGRSPARDIIDSTWSNEDEDENKTLKKALQLIGDKFDISCDTFDSTDPTEIVGMFAFENESPWAKLINEADNQGYILTSNQAGGIYLWKVAKNVRIENFYITEGVNVKSIKWIENGAEQFHTYIVKGDGIKEQATDNNCRGNRTLHISKDNMYSNDSLYKLAKREKLRRNKYEVIVNVPGWGLTNEQIKNLKPTIQKPELFWFPNSLVPVDIPSFGLKDDLLISAVEYTATVDSISCDITLVNKEAYYWTRIEDISWQI